MNLAEIELKTAAHFNEIYRTPPNSARPRFLVGAMVVALGLVMTVYWLSRSQPDGSIAESLSASQSRVEVISPKDSLAGLRQEAQELFDAGKLQEAGRVCEAILAKDPEDRWQSAHDVLVQLKWIREGGSRESLFAPAAARRKNRERLAWVLAVAGAAAALALTAVLVSRTPETRRMVRSSILPPDKAAFAFENGPVAVSPDGRRVAFVARPADGKSALWVRPLTGLSAQPLPGTEGASYPFWSPDSRFLGFFADGKLKKIEASGGPPQTICDAPLGRGGAWNREGVILFTAIAREGILQVSSTGGTPSPATRLDETRQEIGHRLPVFLPDGRHFLFLSSSGPELPRLVCASLDGKETRELLRVNSNVSYVEPGYLLFYRERTLFAQRFDAKRIELQGEAFPVAEQIQYYPDRGFGVFSASNDGTLVYQSGAGAASQMVVTDRAGMPIETVGPPGLYRCPRLSYDGRHVAVDIEDETGRSDIWVYDLSRRASTRLTFGPADNTYPIWSPDDSRIAFISNAKGPGGAVVVKPSSGSGGDEFLTGGDTPGTRSEAPKFTDHWSRDGRFLAYHTVGVQTGPDLWTISLADRKSALFLATPAAEVLPFFSPDGRWIVYQSNESGRFEIYVRPFPQPGGKWQVSTEGGHFPIWSADGKEIFYVGDDSRLTAVPVRAGAGIELGTPEPLFEVHLRRSVLGRLYDVSADGKRFLLNNALEDVRSASLTLVQNWPAELKP
jgi:Tol biopolymer transport system component